MGRGTKILFLQWVSFYLVTWTTESKNSSFSSSSILVSRGFERDFLESEIPGVRTLLQVWIPIRVFITSKKKKTSFVNFSLTVDVHSLIIIYLSFSQRVFLSLFLERTPDLFGVSAEFVMGSFSGLKLHSLTPC